MKSTITLAAISLPLLFAASLTAQNTTVSYVSAPDKTPTEYTVEAPKVESKWKEEKIIDRKDFYATEANFDPAADYASLYSKNEASGMAAKTESGKVKLLNDNNSTPTVYYNNAVAGTILKLTNPDNGKITYAMVVGKVPPADSQAYIVVLSEKAAHNLSIKAYSSVELTCYSDSAR